VTSFNPANAVALGLYTSLGFQPTGEIEDDEPLLLLRLADRRPIGTSERRSPTPERGMLDGPGIGASNP